MKIISLKINDSIFGETEKFIKRMKIQRNQYRNKAIEYYNKIQKKVLLEEKLKKVRVSEDGFFVSTQRF